MPQPQPHRSVAYAQFRGNLAEAFSLRSQPLYFLVIHNPARSAKLLPARSGIPNPGANASRIRSRSKQFNGSTVHVRGLLFFDAGVYKLVGGRIMAP